jgi:hypothetical protein
MKHFSGVCKFAALLLMFALPAVASAPIFTMAPLTSFVITSGPGGCPSFDVLVAPQAGRPNSGKTITFANGSSISTGAVFVTATNLTSSKSINLNISGPGQFSVSDNTFTVLGPSLDIGFQDLGAADLPSVAFVKGPVVLQFDNFGKVISVTHNGASPQDVCQSLE